MDLAQYDQQNQTQLVQQVENLRKYARQLNAVEGMQRLALVADHFENLSVEQAYQLLNPEPFRREIEEVQAYHRRAKFSQYLRTALGLLPLILTWGSLSFAVWGYGNYVSIHHSTQAQTVSFLQLWQNGSLGWLTFFWTGAFDVFLLALFLTFSVISLSLEYSARNQSEQFTKVLQHVSDELIKAVVARGKSGGLTENETRKITQVIKQVMDDSFRDIRDLVEKDKETIAGTEKAMEGVYDNQIKPMLQEFNTGLQRFHGELATLDEKVGELATSGKALAGSATDMASSAATMTGSANSLAANVQAQMNVTNSMNTYLADLSRTEQELVQALERTQLAVATEVRGATREMAAEMRGAAQDMGGDVHDAAADMNESAQMLQTVAGQVEMVGRQLVSVNLENVQHVTQSVMILIDKAGHVATQLQGAAYALSEATDARGQSQGPFRKIARRIKRLIGR